MPTLTIKGMPDDLYRRLKQRAEANHRSLNGEIIACLERVVGGGPVDADQWLAEADALRRSVKLRPMTMQEFLSLKRRGRE